MTAAPADTELLSYALGYARQGFPVFPVWGIRTPAPLKVIDQWRAGKLDKKEAVLHAVCACGKVGCKSPGKHPITNNGARDATTDEAQIRKWFSGALSDHIGVVMPEGHVAIDFDTYTPGVQQRLDALRIVARGTLEQQSGAGGTHLVFSGVPHGFQFATHLDAIPGVDVIHAENRYLVAEPSLHWTGQRYRWVNDSEAVPVPRAVLPRIARGVRPPAGAVQRKPQSASDVPKGLLCPDDVEDPLEWAITLASERLEPAISNDEPGSQEPGHVTLARAACHVIAGCNVDEDTALEVLWEEYNPRCVPPWEEHEREDFERTVRAAGAGAEIGYLLPSEASRVLTAATEQRHAAKRLHSEAARASGAGQSGLSRVPQDQAEAAQGERFAILGRKVNLAARAEPLAYLVEGLPFAPGGKVNALAGPPKGGKSPFALWLCIAVGLGLDFLGRKVLRPGPCMYLDAETGRLAHIRFQRMCVALGIDPNSVPLDFRDVDAMFSPEYLQALEDYLLESPTVLVVIDTYAAMLEPGIDYNSPEFAHWLRQLGRISRAIDVTFVVLVHEKKSNGQRKGTGLEMMSGSFSAAGACQGVITLLPAGEHHDEPIEVMCSRAPEKSFKNFHVLWEDVEDTRPTSERMASGVDEGLGVSVVQVEQGRGANQKAQQELEDQQQAKRWAQRVVTYLAENGACVATKTLIAGAAGVKDGRASSRFAELLERLVEDGIVEKDSGARQHPVYGMAPYSTTRQKALLARGLTLPPQKG